MANIAADEVLQALVEDEFQRLKGIAEKPEQLSGAYSLFMDYLEWGLVSGFEFIGNLGHKLETITDLVMIL